jgi:hypothetical protein
MIALWEGHSMVLRLAVIPNKYPPIPLVGDER